MRGELENQCDEEKPDEEEPDDDDDGDNSNDEHECSTMVATPLGQMHKLKWQKQYI